MPNRIRTALVAFALVGALVATAGVAQAEAAPAKPFTFDHIKKNKKKGTAKIFLNVSGAGSLALEGTGRSNPDKEQANGAGTVAMHLKPNKKGMRKLRNQGKVKFNAVITFTPTTGQPYTQATQVNLILKKKG